MVDRLLVDLGAEGRVSVSALWADELPISTGEPVEINWPLDNGELSGLRWYLEDYLRAPFGVYEERGPRIAGEVDTWGRALFDSVFGAGAARDAYVRLRARGRTPAEIVFRSAAPAWLGLPWELMRDPHIPTPLVLDGVSVSRSLPGAGMGEMFPISGERLRVLMVISRPSGTEDVAYRIIARPLLARLAAVRGKVDLVVLRPPTLDGLITELRHAREAGTPYQIVHFDGHGVPVGDRPGPDRRDVFTGSTRKGALLFEAPGGGADHVEADRVAMVLADAEVPVVVLNACQSGTVSKNLEATVATRLLASGASAVVAMAYSVYAVAAAEFMTAFYERLFAGDRLADAVTAGRARMALQNERPSPKGDLPLADWVVPVHYWRREVQFTELRRGRAVDRPSLDVALDQIRAHGGTKHGVLDPVGEFVGRDDLFHTLEVAARTQQVVILHGAGGVGKTELAKAFGRWWRDTGGVEQPDWVIWHSFEPGVASFGLDGVLSAIGMRVFESDFARLPNAERRTVIEDLLATRRLMLIWDNFESVHSMPAPGSATPVLGADARAELTNFLDGVTRGGRSAVIITSRGPEKWLGDRRRIEVSGLTPSETVEYAHRLLMPYPNAGPHRSDRTFGELLAQLDGHPLSMRLLLPHLETMDAATILAGLRGTIPLPEAGHDGRTASLSICIAYSLRHLDATARRLLVALSLCHGVADADILANFSRADGTPERFRGPDATQWNSVLVSATEVGLLTDLGAGMYRIHPALPPHLAAQWRAEEVNTYPARRATAERALLSAVEAMAAWLEQQIQTGAAAFAYDVVELQYRTFGHALGYALDNKLWRHAEFIVTLLDSYWERGGLDEEAHRWIDRARVAVEDADGQPPLLDQPAGSLWQFLLMAQVNRLLRAGRLDAAEDMLTALNGQATAQADSPQRSRALANCRHQLGIVAMRRGRLDGAEDLLRQSLAIEEAFENEVGTAQSYHELGFLAKARGDLDEAESWYRRSVEIAQRIGYNPGLAISYHQLGVVAQQRGRLDEAEERYLKALTIRMTLGDLPGQAMSYHQLGTVAHSRGRLDDAKELYLEALAIKETRGDHVSLASTYHALGVVAHRHGEADDAKGWYQRALTITQSVGDHTSATKTVAQLCTLAIERGDPEGALEWAVRGLDLPDHAPSSTRLFAHELLARLTEEFGMHALEQTWRRITGTGIPPDVRTAVEQQQNSLKER